MTYAVACSSRSRRRSARPIRGAGRELLDFVVVGGGPTGVELAGAIAELGRHVLACDFRAIDPTLAKVTLLEAGPRILPQLDPVLSARAVAQLAELGVSVVTEAMVEAIDAHGVTLRGGQRLTAGTVLWAAGVRPVPLVRALDVAKDRGGRVVVGPDLSIPSHPEAFAIGDVAAFLQDGQPLPGLSPVALQEGRAAADAIRRTIEGRPRRPFRYLDKGVMATIGRSRAVAQIRRARLSGLVAWLTWLVVHVVFLIGFRNRLVVLLNWIWSYATFKRGARLITGLAHPPVASTPAAARPVAPA